MKRIKARLLSALGTKEHAVIAGELPPVDLSYVHQSKAHPPTDGLEDEGGDAPTIEQRKLFFEFDKPIKVSAPIDTQIRDPKRRRCSTSSSSSSTPSTSEEVASNNATPTSVVEVPKVPKHVSFATSDMNPTRNSITTTTAAPSYFDILLNHIAPPIKKQTLLHNGPGSFIDIVGSTTNSPIVEEDEAVDIDIEEAGEWLSFLLTKRPTREQLIDRGILKVSPQNCSSILHESIWRLSFQMRSDALKKKLSNRPPIQTVEGLMQPATNILHRIELLQRR
ncbi:hypothetical protein PROFUN_05503 [Planoprotostelium fungivorum]|uniref:Uncharacterized protein n=1 Tax=Planoprotostelium fungivorum TaxID=1890364 RepID=A0A2P6NQX1_9EUKA|nr:hypothetical protein PROFUN_05503 [Planoprotostelium fungivorum]